MASNNIDFVDVLKYPVHLLAFCGCFIPMNSLQHETVISQRKRVFQYMYTSLISLVHVANTVRCVGFITHLLPIFNSNLSFILQFFILQMFGSLLFTLQSIVCHYHYFSVHNAFVQYKRDHGFRKDFSWLLKMTKMISYFWITSVLLNTVVAYSFNIFGNVRNSLDFIYPFQEESAVGVTVAKVVFGVASMLMFFPVPGFSIINTVFVDIVKSEFYCLRDEMEEAVTLLEGINEEAFFQARKRHQKLCDMTCKLSRLARLCASMNIVFSILLIFYVIYTLGSGQLSTDQVIIEVGFLAVNILALLFVCFSWGGLPLAASSIIESFDRVCWSGKPMALVQQIHLFISQMSAKRVGIDLYGVMMIDSHSFAVIVGSLITYSLVVIQFQNEDEKMMCSCNGSSPVLML